MVARKTTEERIARLKERIAKKQAEIEALKAQRQKLLHPDSTETGKAKKSDLSSDEAGENMEDEV